MNSRPGYMEMIPTVIEYTLFAKLIKVNLYCMFEIHENATVLSKLLSLNSILIPFYNL